MQQKWKGIGFASIGLEFAFSVLLGLALGWWLDQKYDTGGLATLIGLLLGVLTGYRSLWLALKRANREALEQEREQAEARRKFTEDESSPKNKDSHDDD